MSAHCVGEPLSWLRLELHQLGELRGEEARQVEEHLARCPACSAALAHLAADRRPLPALPLAATGAGDDALAEERQGPAGWLEDLWAWARRPWVAPAFGAVALAAVVLWVVPWGQERGAPGQAASGLKGEGAVELVLLRERDGLVGEAPEDFAPEDRFAVMVTCGATTPQPWDLVVFQGDAVDFPLAAGTPLACGNRQRVPGAFRLGGVAPARVCLVLGAPVPERAALRHRGFAGLPPDSPCRELRPAAP